MLLLILKGNPAKNSPLLAKLYNKNYYNKKVNFFIIKALFINNKNKFT